MKVEPEVKRVLCVLGHVATLCQLILAKRKLAQILFILVIPVDQTTKACIQTKPELFIFASCRVLVIVKGLGGFAELPQVAGSV